MSIEYSCSHDSFMQDVGKHCMTILRNDGVDRHIQFRQPGTSSYWFDLVTMPGILMISGDMGTYVFSRSYDMFEFFSAAQRYAKVGELLIHPSYWSEKLLAVDTDGYGRGDIREFDYELFKQQVMEHYDQHYAEQIECEREARLDCEGEEIPQHLLEEWQAEAEVRASVLLQIEEDLFDEGITDSDAHQRLYEFDCSDDPEFRFNDSWEWSFKCYTFHFIWCLYAIQYGIQRFQPEAAATTLEA